MIRHGIALTAVTLLLASYALAQRRNSYSVRVVTPRFSTSFMISPQGALEERIAYLSKDISDGLTENQKRTIAVVEFADLRGNVTDFGRFIAEELITRLHQTKKFKVIERHLTQNVAEQNALGRKIDQHRPRNWGSCLDCAIALVRY